jgi:hypothetical protein
MATTAPASLAELGPGLAAIYGTASPLAPPALPLVCVPVAAAPPCDIGSPLLRLPPDVMRSVLARLLPADCAALRASSRAGRAASAPRAARLALRERDLAAAARLPLALAAAFPEARELQITLDGSSRTGGGVEDGDGDSSDDGGMRAGGAAPSHAPAPPRAAPPPGRFAGSCTVAASAAASGGGGASGAARGRRRGGVEARAAAVIDAVAPEVRASWGLLIASAGAGRPLGHIRVRRCSPGLGDPPGPLRARPRPQPPSLRSTPNHASPPPRLPSRPQAFQLSVLTGACGARTTDVSALLSPAGTRRLRRLWVRAPQIQEPALVAVGRLTALEVRARRRCRSSGPGVG